MDKKRKLFYILQVIGWLSLFTIYMLLYRRENITDISIVLAQFFTQFSGFISSFFLWYFYKKIKLLDRPVSQLIIFSILSSIIVSNIWYVLDVGLSTSLNPLESYIGNLTFRTYSSIIWSQAFVLLTWTALYFGINFWLNFQEQKQLSEKANALAQSAQLQMLRYQLNPHFLFNSLNSIRALVDEDRIKAKSMITELSEFLRYSLLSKNFSNVPLESELDAMRHYLTIEKTRYEENLEIHYEIEQEAEEFPVLSFMLHPIIENAIKYGMQTSDLPLKVFIKAHQVNDELFLSVTNSGKWYDKENKSSTGTGLNNVRQRLESAYKNNFSFNIEKRENEVEVIIRIKKQVI